MADPILSTPRENETRAEWTNRRLTALGKICFYIFLVGASFDTIFVLYFGNLRLRLIIPVIVLGGFFVLVEVLRSRRLVLPVGWLPLLILTAWNGVLCLNTPDRTNAFAYQLWLMADIAAVGVAVNVFQTEKERTTLQRVFLLTFAGLSAIAFLQVVVGLSGGSFYTEQWTTPALPRPNAFSTEPSYFASVMIVGFVYVSWLLEMRNERLFSRRVMWPLFAAVGLTLVFTGSRMGLIMIGLWFALRYGLIAYDALRRRPVRERLTAVLTQTVTIAACFLLFLAVIRLSSLLYKPLLTNPATYTSRYADLHDSFTVRLTGMETAWEAFLKSPWIGVSLGGVEYRCRLIYQAKGMDFIGVSGTLLEMMAGFGLTGMVAVAYYVARLVKAGRKCSRDLAGTESRNAVGALWAAAWLIGILQFNNNVLRPYMWTAVAVVSLLCEKRTVLFPARPRAVKHEAEKESSR